MQYTGSLTLTTSGSSASPSSEDIKCAKGVIHKIELVFPAGCAGLVHCYILQGAHPIAPSTAGQNYVADDEVVVIPEFTELENFMNTLTIYAWNEDDTYTHTIYYRVYVLPKWVLMPAGAHEGLIYALKSIFSRRYP